MNSSQNDVRVLWERCLYGTMYYRRFCASRPQLYITDAGTMVLDTSQCGKSDAGLVSLIFSFCDTVADGFGFTLICSRNDTGLDIWQKGGTA